MRLNNLRTGLRALTDHGLDQAIKEKGIVLKYGKCVHVLYYKALK